jgi:hypothetical protein
VIVICDRAARQGIFLLLVYFPSLFRRATMAGQKLLYETIFDVAVNKEMIVEFLSINRLFRP